MSTSFVEIDEAVRILKSGGLILMDTDTLPGFHCRADSAEGVARIAVLKRRAEGKPLLVLASSVEQAKFVLAPLESRQADLAEACWPGPFSIIFPARDGLLTEVTAGRGTVGVRVPGVESVRKLVHLAGFPLVSTSVNLAGEEPAGDLVSASKRFGSLVNGTLNLGFQLESGGQSRESMVPSALIDATVWPPLQLRAGPSPLPSLDPQS